MWILIFALLLGIIILVLLFMFGGVYYGILGLITFVITAIAIRNIQ